MSEPSLKSRIQKAEKALKSPKKMLQEPTSRFFHVGVELLAGVLVGAGLGVLTDKIFDTSPWGLIGFFVLGSLAGLLNVYRALTRPLSKHNNHPHA